ncbi:MAG: hypothetical protein FJ088_02715 [Deltaproteobacteria bacterium]|nr:hypothetical protein [Deltaproteobacteria bacterium]
MRVFGSERIKGLMAHLGVPEDEPIEQNMVSRAIESAQAKIEGFNFDLRKHVLEYDDVLAKQRETVYRKRREILGGNAAYLKESIETSIRGALAKLLDHHFTREEGPDVKEIEETTRAIVTKLPDELGKKLRGESWTRESLEEFLFEFFSQELGRRAQVLGERAELSFRAMLLRILDMLWMGHLETMENLRDSVRLRAYGQRDPLIEYKSEGYRLYRELLDNFDVQVLSVILRLE